MKRSVVILPFCPIAALYLLRAVHYCDRLRWDVILGRDINRRINADWGLERLQRLKLSVMTGLYEGRSVIEQEEDEDIRVWAVELRNDGVEV